MELYRSSCNKTASVVTSKPDEDQDKGNATHTNTGAKVTKTFSCCSLSAQEGVLVHSPSSTKEQIHDQQSCRGQIHASPQHGCSWLKVPPEAADGQHLEEPVYSCLPRTSEGRSATEAGGKAGHWVTRENAVYGCQRSLRSPPRTAGPNKVAVRNWTLNTDRPSLNDEDLFKGGPSLHKDVWDFNHDEIRRIQRASEHVIASTLAEVLRDLLSVSPGHLHCEHTKEISFLKAKNPQDLLPEQWMYQIVSVSEICVVAREITHAVLKALHVTLSHVLGATKATTSSSAHPVAVNDADIPNKQPLGMWFQGGNQMKSSCSLHKGLTKSPSLKSWERQSLLGILVKLSDKITYSILTKLSAVVSPKLQKYIELKSDAAMSRAASLKSSLMYQLGAYSAKMVNIILNAILEKLEKNNRALNLWESGPPESFVDTGYFVNTKKKFDSVVTTLDKGLIANILAPCICEKLGGTPAKRAVPFPSDSIRVLASHGNANSDRDRILGPSDLHQQLAVAQTRQSVFHEMVCKKNARFQLLHSIEDTLCDMLVNLIRYHLQSPKSSQEENGQWGRGNVSTLRQTTPLISNTILENILTKISQAEMYSSFSYSECKALLEYFDTDGQSFVSLLEDMSTRTNRISTRISSRIPKDNKEVKSLKAKTGAPKRGSTKVKSTNKLKILASDILNTVFAKVETFATEIFKIMGIIIPGKEKMSLLDKRTNLCTGMDEGSVLLALRLHATHVASSILQIIQRELDMSLPSMATCVGSLQQKEMLKNIINFILEALSLDMFHDTEPEERCMEKYRYRPTYGNLLPAGSKPGAEDPLHKKTEYVGKATSLKSVDLLITLENLDDDLREPLKPEIMAIIRNTLTEIFEEVGLNFANVSPPRQPHPCHTPPTRKKSFVRATVRFQDEITSLFVSETDVTEVTDKILTGIFQKFQSFTKAEQNVVATQRSIYLPHCHSVGKDSDCAVSVDREPCTFQSSYSVEVVNYVDMVDDILQSVLASLETFTTSQIKSLSCLPAEITVALSASHSETKLCRPELSFEHPYSHQVFGKRISECETMVSKLTKCSIEVAMLVLQGIKHKFDEQFKRPFVNYCVSSESIPVAIVNGMLENLSARHNFEKCRETVLNQPESVVEKLFTETGYQKQLENEILQTLKKILSDLCEQTLDENSLQVSASEVADDYANKAILVHVFSEYYAEMMASNMVTIVLRNVRSLVMLRIHAKKPVSGKLPQTSTKAFPKATNEMSTKNFLLCRKLKLGQELSSYFDDHQAEIQKNQMATKFSPNPYMETVHFTTNAILNCLRYFVLEWMHLLMPVNSQVREDQLPSPTFVSCLQEEHLSLGSHQIQSEDDILKSSKTALSQGISDHMVATCRQKHKPTIHTSLGSLKEHSIKIVRAILMVLKKDIDAELENMDTNETASQEINIVRTVVQNILNSVYEKRSVKKSSFYSGVNPSTKQVVPKEVLCKSRLEYKIDLSCIAKSQDETVLSKKVKLKRVLNDIFVGSRGARQERTSSLLNVIKEMLKKVHQTIIEDPLNSLHESPKIASDHHFKTSPSAQGKPMPPQISNVANDIIERVLGKMFSVLMTCLYEGPKTWIDSESSSSGGSPVAPSDFQRKEVKERNIPTGYTLPPLYPCTEVPLKAWLHYFPEGVGDALVQMVVHKLRNFALQNLEENSSLKGQSDYTQSLMPGSSKDNPKAGLKTNIKAKSKVTSLPKFGARLQVEASHAEAKCKTKLGPAERATKVICSLPTFGPQPQSNNLTRALLPEAELKMHATKMVCAILEWSRNEFERVRQDRTKVNVVEALPSDQIVPLIEMVSAVLKNLYSTKKKKIVSSVAKGTSFSSP